MARRSRPRERVMGQAPGIRAATLAGGGAGGNARFRFVARAARMLVRRAAGRPGAARTRSRMPDAPTAPIASPWRRLWRDWLAPHWPLLAVSLAMTWVVAAASAGYAKLIQLVMDGFAADASAVMVWGPLGVIALSCGERDRAVLPRDDRQPGHHPHGDRAAQDDVRAAGRHRPGAAADRGAGGAGGAVLVGHQPGRRRGARDARGHHRHPDDRGDVRRDADDRLAADARHLRDLRAGAGAGEPDRDAAPAARRRAPRRRWRR